MLVPSSAETESTTGLRYFAGIAILALGYTTALIGGITYTNSHLLAMTIPIGGILVAMILPGKIDYRLTLRGSKNSSAVILAMVGILSLVSVAFIFWCPSVNWKTKHFRFSPGRFQIVCVTVVAAYIHCLGILGHLRRKRRNTDIPVTDYDEALESNPYSPPMQTKHRTNNPMGRSGGSAAS